jgi:hypothetical protein
MTKHALTKQTIIESLCLEPHPSEGGYFKRTYTSETELNCGYGQRKTLSSIYYMLTDDSPIGYLHKNKSDIIHYFHSGSPITYFIIHPDGQLETTTLGNDLSNGQQLQLTVRGGCWKASELEKGQHDFDYGLLSEAVSPGFEYEDMELAEKPAIQTLFPAIFADIEKYIR